MSESKPNINWFPGHMAKSLREIEGSLKLVDIIIEILERLERLSLRRTLYFYA